MLTTNPSHTNARWKLAAVVCWARAARRLYSAHISAIVAAGTSRARIRSTCRSIGERQPPARGCGSTERAVRQHPTHRANVRWSTSNSAASCAYEPAPRSYAIITARFRSATSYGFGMASFKYTPVDNASGNRD